MGDGVLTDQLSHNHCHCTDSHWNSHIVLRVFSLPFVPSPITSPSAAEAAKRLRRDEEVLDAPEVFSSCTHVDYCTSFLFSLFFHVFPHCRQDKKLNHTDLFLVINHQITLITFVGSENITSKTPEGRSATLRVQF